ncbi:helix-turn-helix domain-containing protein [Anaerococcus sp. Marseille-Q5996]|uniref:helix-turn-helix domain-containing protein n=1 Tax=Anaerococcus sp. Marseille-Q5996 TaxID=2972769 RepID=UPI0021C8660F|nr:helix-turn-helix domain-containing protein [Anaerococcus sp. Marseille-Q5996]
MTRKLTLSLSFNQVFTDYSEVFVGNSLRFEGCLKPCFEGVSNFNLIRFVSGGRRYVTYRLDRDGDFVRGVIRYRALAEADPEFIEVSIAKMEAAIGRAPRKMPQTRAVNDAQIDKIRLLHASGMSQRDIARDMDIHYMTVGRIINRKGAYAE